MKLSGKWAVASTKGIIFAFAFIVALAGNSFSQTVLIGGDLRNGNFNNHDSILTDKIAYSNVTTWVNIGSNGQSQQATRSNLTYIDGSLNLVVSEADTSIAAQDSGHTIAAGDFLDVSYVWRDAYNWDASGQVAIRLFTTDTDLIDGTATDFATLLSGTANPLNNTDPYESVSGSTNATAAEAGKRLFVAIDTADDNDSGFARLDNFVLTVTPYVLNLSFVLADPVATSVTTTNAQLSATLGDTNANVTLYWEVGPVPDPASSYTGWDGSNMVSDAAAGVVQLLASNLVADTLYSIAFFATNATEGLAAWSDVGVFTTSLSAAQAPVFSSAVAAAWNSIELGWADNASHETGYLLQRSTNGADFTLIASLDADTTSYTDQPLTVVPTTYTYRLAATNANNGSATAFVLCETNVAAMPPEGLIFYDSFEAPDNLLGWSMTGSGGINDESDGFITPYGEQAVGINGSVITTTDILADVLQANYTYTLTFNTARRSTMTARGNSYIASLLAGSTTLASTNGAPTTSDFSESGEIVFTTDASHSHLIGETLAIKFAIDTDYQPQFDNVMLLANPSTSPPSVVDDTASAFYETATNIYVLANDEGFGIGIDTVDAAATNASGSAAGAVALAGSGDYVTYTPANGFFGDALFSYVVTNANGSATGRVTVSVAGLFPIAVGDTVSTPYQTLTNVYVLANDINDGLGIDSVVLGSVTNANGDAVGTADYTVGTDYVAYTPGNGFSGEAYFSYVVTNALGADTGLVTVTVGIAPPAAGDDTASAYYLAPTNLLLLGNDSGEGIGIESVDANSTNGSGNAGSVVFSAGNDYVTYTPSVLGEASFSYVVTNSVGSDTGMVTVTAVEDASVPVFNSAVAAAWNSIQLGWLDNASSETGYLLQRSTNGTDFELVATLTANTTSHTDEPVTVVPTTYTYRLAATNSTAGTATPFVLCETNATAQPPDGLIFYDSFEDPDITGTSSTDPTGWVVENGGLNDENSNLFTTPYGGQALWLNSGTATTTASILSEVLQANYTYTLTFNIGRRSDGLFPSKDNSYIASLLAGATTLVSTNGNATTTVFSESVELVFTPDAGHAGLIGETLAIQFEMDTEIQPHFDNVMLLAQDITPSGSLFKFR